MANKYTRYLSDVGKGIFNGLTNPKGIVGNWQHATRLFIDDTYRLAPRTNYMFYVRFEIDKTAHRAPAFTARHGDEVGLLVKGTDLPKFNFDSVIKNQYNRKKIVYKNFNYEPVNITMHDDNAGIVNALWAIYYGYYIADRHNPQSAYSATHLRAVDTTADKFRYGMDNDITTPLFKSISIYTMSRRRFLGYTLVNPRIKSWNHGTVAYSEGGTLESTMTVEYEAVKYTTGKVARNSPKGFATLHYDNTPSPLSVAGGGVANLFGDGGVLDGIEEVFGDVENGSAFDSVGGFLGTAIKAVNTYKNIKGLSKEGLKAEALSVLTNPGNIASATSGIVGAIFPKTNGGEASTSASQKSMVNK